MAAKYSEEQPLFCSKFTSPLLTKSHVTSECPPLIALCSDVSNFICSIDLNSMIE